ncbi:transcription termination/antitermination protein NusG [Methylobacterium nigriterrae]|uniref:transcription termination/antitermination protein NusG n=1 Tax=Methylobacterium nigriterrae TaxID=3127512 RepID=UPI003013616D
MPSSRLGRYSDAKATPQHNFTILKDVPLPDEKRNKVPEIKTPGVSWYVCTTVPQAELRAAESLRRTEVDGDKLFLAYTPCEFFWRRPQRANLKLPRREFQRPTMRHYLFVGIKGGASDEALAALRERDSEGRNTHGLMGILGSARGPLSMNESGLEWLADRAQEERAGRTSTQATAPFERDEAVRIAAGPFAGFFSRVLAVDDTREQVVVEISLMGRRSEMRMSFEHVHKAA